jgi:sugar phosphate isomerase/epimerase
MFLTGFADEVSSNLETQIAATKELGWKFIETRAIGNTNLAGLSEEEFEKVCGLLEDSGISFNCYGSSVANWQCHPRSEEDFQKSKKELLSAIPRMQKLGIKIIRGMSFKYAFDEGAPDSPELEKIIFTKVNELVKICEDAGIIYGHENCMNYGGLSYLHTLKLLDNVKSPNFKLIYDTGNPCFSYRRIGNGPYPLQSSWEFYSNVKEFITYVHIKDGTALPLEDGVTRPACKFCWAGDGCGDIRAIVKDLKNNNYQGGFSIEPHVAAVFHEANPDSNMDQIRYDSYIEYGRRFEKLLKECGW